jgi:hypothetical protein
MKQLLTDRLVTLQAYYTRVVNLYNFEPRKKYIQELVDTDKSDATTDEYDTDDDEDNATDRLSVAFSAFASNDVDHNAGERDAPLFNDPFSQSLGTVFAELQSHGIAMDIDDGKIPCDVV